MTNAEKYLKDGVDEVAFAGELADIFLSKMEEKYPYAVDAFIDYFHDLAEPQLTEDEKVILRNLNEQIWEKIGRDKYGTLSLKTRTNDDDNFFNCCYGHLFQFIKERRRIFY